jgi:hypothetical protein
MTLDNCLPDSYVPISNVSFSERMNIINNIFIPKEEIYIRKENSWERISFYKQVVFEYEIAISGRDFFELNKIKNNE